LGSGIQDAYQSLLPRNLLPAVDYVFPASCALALGTSSVAIRSSGDSANVIWLAPAGTTHFAAGATMTTARGDATSIAIPSSAGSYKLSIVNSQGTKLGESAALLRVK
jgi:hypothetical protein